MTVELSHPLRNMANVMDIEDQADLYTGAVDANARHEERKLLDYEEPTERTGLLDGFPYSLVMKVSSLEPRDVLQTERTCLTFIRFSTTLFFTALGIVLNFRLESDGKGKKTAQSTFSKVVAYALLTLSIATLLVSGVNYFLVVNRYAMHKISTTNATSFASMMCVTGVIITLVGINIGLIIEGYIEEE